MKKALLSLIFFTMYSLGYSQTPLTTAVQFEAKDFNGIPHDLFNYLNNGNFVLLNFYTLNCGTCQTYTPHVNTIYHQYGCNTGDLVVLGVNWGATNQQVNAHHQQYGWSFPALSGIEGYGNEITSNYQIQSFISVILIAPDHVIVNQYIYPPTTTQLQALLDSYGISQMPCALGSGVSKNSGNALLRPYPNPAREFFNLNSTKHGLRKISLIDMTGTKIRSYETLESQHSVYSLSGVAPGYYLLEVIDDSNLRHLFPLIVLP